VRFSNYCDIGLKVLDDGRIIVISTIDNLVKGASGQALQNMNVALNLPETAGLSAIPQYP
jgi:N-acetyl-gamma-glutamyl-phosphate reductase